MKSKVLYSIAIGLLIIVISAWVISTKTWRVVSTDGTGGGGFGPSGTGLAFATTTWRSSSGGSVTEEVIGYSSLEDARKAFEIELNGEGRIVEQNARTEADSRVVKVRDAPGSPNTPATIIKL